MERAAMAEREELLKGGADKRQLRIRRMQDANSVLQASEELTETLRQAVGMMSAELGKSVEVAKTLGMFIGNL